MMREAPGSDGTCHALAMVLLTGAGDLTAKGLADAWRSSWPDAPPLGGVQEAPSSLTCSVGPLVGAVGMMPGTIPGGELEGPASTSPLWPDARRAIREVGAHVVVWVSGPGNPLEAHRQLTRLVAAVLRATGALGVYWGSAGLVVRADIFDEVAHSYEGALLPVMLWVDFRLGRERGGFSLFTVGLHGLGLPEIEIPPSRRAPGDLRDFATNVATYLIEHGPVINDGDTVGGDEHERITARHAPSAFDRPGLVLRLEGC